MVLFPLLEYTVSGQSRRANGFAPRTRRGQIGRTADLSAAASRPWARHAVRDRVTDQVVHRSAVSRIERQVSVLAIPHQQTLPLERSAGALGEAMNKRL